MIVYSQWTAWRENPSNTALSAQEVREAVENRLGKLQKRAYKTARKKLLTEDKTHAFPFGAMRSHVLSCDATRDFLTKMQRGKTPVYVHIQDADFQNLKTQPQFYTCPKGVTPIVDPEEEYLFKRFDALIAHRKQQGVMPLMVGGAHVYTPDEEVQNTTPASRTFTRFGSEMGNGIKHIIGVYEPYGLHFHEPNTLVLSPVSLSLVNKNVEGWDKVMMHFNPSDNPFVFGINSELQEFLRALLKGLSHESHRNLMLFSADAVLATSMKRGGQSRNFAIKFSVSYDEEKQRFLKWSLADICHIHGMPQEIVHPNSWASVLCSGWKADLVQDARTDLANLFNIFDPYKDAQNRTQFWRCLIKMDETLDNSDDIKVVFNILRGKYNKNCRGDIIAFYMLSQAWETAQFMRIMFLDYFEPTYTKRRVPKLRDIRAFLARRRNFSHAAPYPLEPNPFVVEILGLARVPTPYLPSFIAAKVARFLYDQHGTKKKAAEVLGTTSSTLNKVIKQESPRKSKEITKTLSGVRSLYEDESDKARKKREKHTKALAKRWGILSPIFMDQLQELQLV